jgi:uncharacterized membrane protein
MIKNFSKTMSWMICSIFIIGISAWLFGADLKSATMTGIIASISKTPFFSIHEYIFEKLWKGKNENNSIISN